VDESEEVPVHPHKKHFLDNLFLHSCAKISIKFFMAAESCDVEIRARWSQLNWYDHMLKLLRDGSSALPFSATI
jgi:hypothetical protein